MDRSDAELYLMREVEIGVLLEISMLVSAVTSHGD